jgi:hypothetical protein
VSFNRRMTRPDSNQQAIVDALRAVGVIVEIIGQPVDLLTFYQGRWLPLEVKPLKKTHSKPQKRQTDFIKVTGCPVVKTVQEAYAVVLGPLTYDAKAHSECYP